MAVRLRQGQSVSVTNHINACQSLIECAVTWLANDSGWARRKRSAICSGKLCGGFIIFKQCCPCGGNHVIVLHYWFVASDSLFVLYTNVIIIIISIRACGVLKYCSDSFQRSWDQVLNCVVYACKQWPYKMMCLRSMWCFCLRKLSLFSALPEIYMLSDV